MNFGGLKMYLFHVRVMVGVAAPDHNHRGRLSLNKGPFRVLIHITMLDLRNPVATTPTGIRARLGHLTIVADSIQAVCDELNALLEVDDMADEVNIHLPRITVTQTFPHNTVCGQDSERAY